MKFINREAVIIKPKQPFVDWVNSKRRGNKHKYTLEELSEGSFIYLIPSYLADSTKSYEFIKQKFKTIFNFELCVWGRGEKSWPKNRTWEMFQEWFEIDIHIDIFDLVNKNIKKEKM